MPVAARVGEAILAVAVQLEGALAAEDVDELGCADADGCAVERDLCVKHGFLSTLVEEIPHWIRTVRVQFPGILAFSGMLHATETDIASALAVSQGIW